MSTDQMSMVLNRIDDRISISRTWFRDYGFHLVDTIQKLKQLVDICISRGICSLDVETTGVDNRVYSDEFFNDGIKTRHGMRTVDTIAGLCISFDGKNGYYIPVSHIPVDSNNLPWDPAWDEITRLVYGCKCIFHFAKFDQEFLYPLTGKEYWGRDEYEDTWLVSKVISPLKSTPAGLKHLIRTNFSIETIDIHELFTQELKDQLKREKRHLNFALLHPKEGLEYGGQDGIFTYKMFFHLTPKLSEEDKKIYNLEKAFTNVLRKMERNRVHLDISRVEQLYAECKKSIEQVGDAIRETIEHHTGNTGKWLTLNVGSPKQMSIAMISDQEGLRLKPTPFMLESENEGGGSSRFSDALSDDDDSDDSDELEVVDEKQYSLKDEAIKSLQEAYGSKFMIQRPGVVDKDKKPKPESIFDLILEYRHFDKMKGSFVEKLFLSHDKYGDVRPTFNQMGTDTARLSSTAGKIDQGFSGINFQGIPRDSDEDKPELFKQIRTCIVPRPGWLLVKLDFAGEELRVMANMSGDKIWTKSFLYEDGDVHSITSRILFAKENVNKDERNRGKRSNFAIIYGGGAGSIQRNVGCSIEDAQRHMNGLRKGIPEVMGYVDSQKKYAKLHKCVFTAYGRRVPIPTIDSPIKSIRAKAERCAINYTIQATSADILKFAMCYVDKNIRQLKWEDRVKYILTVHDEVVFEIKPEYVMEIVRKLDEWMTFPWQLPKAHGRPWVVPLLTEPGIDINWKARYDYFKMVDGTKAKPSEISSSGEFTGKLKKDEEFLNGHIYQKIPDFLTGVVEKLDRRQIEGKGSPKQIESHQEMAPPNEVELSVSNETINLLPEPEPEPEPTLDSETLVVENKTPELENAVMREQSKNVMISDGVVEETSKPESVYRWVFKSVPTERTQRKLEAIIILTEGDSPLRIVNQQGSIMLSENDGVKVNIQEFEVITRLFGI